MLFFDIPNNSKIEAKSYRAFMKFIKGSGYMILQESVYIKLIRNISSHKRECKKLRGIAPKNSNILVLPLSFNDFQKIEAISGCSFDFDMFSNKVLYL